MAEVTLNSVLNFIIPIGVWIFLAWIIYRIPVVKEGITKLREWMASRGNKQEETTEGVSIKSIDYE